jgi:hypothetical protein
MRCADCARRGLAHDLDRLGFDFASSITCYACVQFVGRVKGHQTTCFATVSCATSKARPSGAGVLHCPPDGLTDLI